MEEVDLVMLDITMPVMDGGDCFRALKKLDPDVKAVLTSGHALDGTFRSERTRSHLLNVDDPRRQGFCTL